MSSSSSTRKRTERSHSLPSLHSSSSSTQEPDSRDTKRVKPAPPCVNNNCDDCQKKISDLSSTSQLELEDYEEIFSDLDYKVPEIGVWPFQNNLLHKIPVRCLSRLLSPSSLKMYKLVGPHGYGKTEFIKFCCAYFEGTAPLLEAYPALQQECKQNGSRFNVKYIDLMFLGPTNTLHTSLATSFKSILLPAPSDLSFGSELEKILTSKNSHPWYLFFDHCENVNTEDFNFLMQALSLIPSATVVWASSRELSPFEKLPSISFDSYFGYTLTEIEKFFPRHLELLSKLPPFKEDNSRSVIEQIEAHFQSSQWDESLFLRRAGRRAYPFSLINQLMLTGVLPDPPKRSSQPASPSSSSSSSSTTLPSDPYYAPLIHNFEALTATLIRDFYQITKIPTLYDIEDLKHQLGPFYQRPLPQRTSKELDLRLLGVMEWMEAVEKGDTASFKHLPSVDEILEKLSLKSVAPYIILGPSGCGKTRIIFDVATQHPVVFMNCVNTNPEPVHVHSEDLNYPILFKACERMLTDNNPKPKLASDLVQPLILTQLSCRMLLLLSLLSRPDMYTPSNYLLLQLNDGQSMIRDAWDVLSRLPGLDSLEFISYLLKVIRSKLVQGQQVIFALDEASSAANALSKFRSPSKKKRGFLTALTYALLRLASVPIFYAGTGLSLAQGRGIESQTMKGGPSNKVLQFPLVENAMQWFSKYINLQDCQLTPLQDFYLKGRFRLATSIISSLPITVCSKDSHSTSKQEKFRRTVENQLTLFRATHTNKLSSLQDSTQGDTILNLLGDTVSSLLFFYYSKTVPGQIPPNLLIDSHSPLNSAGNCLLQDGFIFLRQSGDTTQTFEIAEPLIAETLVDFFSKFPTMPKHSMLLAWRAINSFEIRKISSSAGGFALEAVFRVQFQIYQTHKNSLHEAFAMFGPLPKWIENPKLKFQLNDDADLDLDRQYQYFHHAPADFSFFRLYKTPNQFGPDVFLISQVDGLWYCISGAMKIFAKTIDRQLRFQNWAAANPGMMFRKLVASKDKAADQDGSVAQTSKPLIEYTIPDQDVPVAQTSKPKRPLIEYTIESFKCPAIYQYHMKSFHNATEHAFNWHDTEQFKSEKLGGALILNILLQPKKAKFESLPLPNDERIKVLNIDITNYHLFFQFDYLREQLDKAFSPTSSSSSSSFQP